MLPRIDRRAPGGYLDGSRRSAVTLARDETMTRLSSAESGRTLPEAHPAVMPRRIGVLLVNLGTPDGTGYRPMRRYLKEFLSDRRVIEVPRALWWPILNLAILTVRPTKS